MQFLGIGSYHFIHVSFLIIFFAPSYRSLYILFHVKSAFTDVSFYRDLHTFAITGQKVFRLYSIPQKSSSFLDFGDSMSDSACNFLCSRLMPCQIISPKNGILVHLKRLIFVKLQVCLPIYSEYLVSSFILVFTLTHGSLQLNIISNTENIWYTTK